MSVVTVEEARAHLNLLDPSRDDYIAHCIAAAEAHVEQYLGRPLDPWGEGETCPDDVKHAILLLIGSYFSLREGLIVGAIRADNPAVDALLHFHRKGLGI